MNYPNFSINALIAQHTSHQLHTLASGNLASQRLLKAPPGLFGAAQLAAPPPLPPAPHPAPPQAPLGQLAQHPLPLPLQAAPPPPPPMSHIGQPPFALGQLSAGNKQLQTAPRFVPDWVVAAASAAAAAAATGQQQPLDGSQSMQFGCPTSRTDGARELGLKGAPEGANSCLLGQRCELTDECLPAQQQRRRRANQADEIQAEQCTKDVSKRRAGDMSSNNNNEAEGERGGEEEEEEADEDDDDDEDDDNENDGRSRRRVRKTKIPKTVSLI